LERINELKKAKKNGQVHSAERVVVYASWERFCEVW
jgi:uncharacterized protein YnzC (UPF0291/DUF896 family)